MSGSALADIGGIGRIEIDAMRRKGFTAPFAAAVTSSSAIVGPIFPPSIPLIIYGTVTGVSVIQLLLGGILPGPALRGDADADDRLARRPAQLSARRALADAGASCGAISSPRFRRSSRR